MVPAHGEKGASEYCKSLFRSIRIIMRAQAGLKGFYAITYPYVIPDYSCQHFDRIREWSCVCSRGATPLARNASQSIRRCRGIAPKGDIQRSRKCSGVSRRVVYVRRGGARVVSLGLLSTQSRSRSNSGPGSSIKPPAALIRDIHASGLRRCASLSSHEPVNSEWCKWPS
jgi:hypothetical protein